MILFFFFFYYLAGVEEIKEIRARFDKSRHSIAKIKRKLTMDKKWETEIQDAIEEVRVSCVWDMKSLLLMGD